MVVFVGLPAGSVGVVPNEMVVFVELVRFRKRFNVVLFVEHVSRQRGLNVVVFECGLCRVLG